MAHAGTAREALLAELLGDVAALLDRVDAQSQQMKCVSTALQQSIQGSGNTIAAIHAEVTAISTQAQVKAVAHVVRETYSLQQLGIQVQREAMVEVARTVVAQELANETQRVAATLRQLLRQAQTPWRLWLTHAATAALSAALTEVLCAAPWR